MTKTNPAEQTTNGVREKLPRIKSPARIAQGCVTIILVGSEILDKT